jgi:ElaB/YqjD/DUF883 family membrane-anchored ribosome-binding protein
MADQVRTSTPGASGRDEQANASVRAAGLNKMPGSLKDVADQAVAVSRDIKSKAYDLAGASSEVIMDQAASVADAARDVAAQAGDRIKDTVDDQKAAGAQYVGNLADTLRRAAKEFDSDLPIAGTYIRKAANKVEEVSDSIRTGSFDDLVRETQSFARRQPTAFLGMAVLAGFGLVRFLKSSSGVAEDNSLEGNDVETRTSPARPRASKGGYRDEFAK